MYVRIYPLGKGRYSVLLQPSRGKHMFPVYLSDMTKAEAKARVGPEIRKMRGDPPAEQGELPF